VFVVCDRKNKNDENYIEWFEQHQQECSLNHVGSAGKMEVDAIKEMFSASEESLEYGISIILVMVTLKLIKLY